MEKDSLKKSVLNNLIWKFGERIGAQCVSFIVSIVLARLLLPADYGLVTMVTIFITIANVFVSNGFGESLVQKKDADNVDFSTIFYFEIVFSFGIYMILFITAPYIADFYNEPVLCNVLRVFALRVPLAGINSVQQAYVKKKMIFKKFFFSTIIGTIVSAVVGIALAYRGFGVWALIAQYLCNSVMDTVILWVTVKWRPNLVFSVTRLKELVTYGWKIMAAGLINSFYSQLRSLVIGKVYTASDLAYYNRAQQFPQLLVTNVNASIDGVLFPAMSNEQNDKKRIVRIMRRSIKVSSFVLFPLMIGLAVVSTPLIRLMLTEKWLPCVPYLQVICIQFMLQPIQTANLQAIKALGRSDLFLKLEIIKKIVGILSILLVMRMGVMAIAVTEVLYSVYASVINASPNKKLLGYGYKAQIIDIFPAVSLSLVMGIIVNLYNYLQCSDIMILVLQVITGAIIYMASAYIFKIESFSYILSMIKEYIKK